MTMKPMSEIRAEFDQIARVSGDGGWDHNGHYHDFLLMQLPGHCDEALEIGCGTGTFAQLLAGKATRVTALDLSPEMVRIARERSRDYSNIDYQIADVLAWEFPKVKYDCIASIATLHHLPLEGILARMRDALRPGGTLLVLDLYQAEGMGGKAWAALGLPVSATLRLAKTGRLRPRHTPESRAAWEAHGHDEVYPTLTQVRTACEKILPGAQVRRHVLWRYSLVWQKPSSI
jgi:SAM-dependent methyltransferase